MEEKFMNIAIKEARKAFDQNEVPVGAVIVKNNKVIAKAYNQKEKYGMVTKHAEIIALEKASKKLKNWRLDECDMYITLEPCPMCASAIKQARISNIYCGLANSDGNNKKIIDLILQKNNINNSVNIEISDYVRIKELLKAFFHKKR